VFVSIVVQMSLPVRAARASQYDPSQLWVSTHDSSSRACLALSLIAELACAQTVVDPTLQVQTYFGGLDQPTGVAFINGLGDALVTQKNDGRVILFRNRKRIGTALDLPVASSSEHGLLSIALSPSFATDRFVYLYHTVAGADGGDPIANRISRYKLSGDRLVFNRAIINLPASPGPNHDGGKIAFDKRGLLYTVIGTSTATSARRTSRTQTSSRAPARSCGLTPTGQPVANEPVQHDRRAGRRRRASTRTAVATASASRSTRSRETSGTRKTARSGWTRSTRSAPASTAAGRTSWARRAGRAGSALRAS
jgi:glucose/arabinose dehydrogenase